MGEACGHVQFRPAGTRRKSGTAWKPARLQGHEQGQRLTDGEHVQELGSGVEVCVAFITLPRPVARAEIRCRPGHCLHSCCAGPEAVGCLRAAATRRLCWLLLDGLSAIHDATTVKVHVQRHARNMGRVGGQLERGRGLAAIREPRPVVKQMRFAPSAT